MASPTVIETQAEKKPCPFCGHKTPSFYDREPYGYWGDGYHPTYRCMHVVCGVCSAAGPVVECQTFRRWTDNKGIELRGSKEEYNRYKAEHVEYEQECINEAIEKWNKAYEKSS